MEDFSGLHTSPTVNINLSDIGPALALELSSVPLEGTTGVFDKRVKLDTFGKMGEYPLPHTHSGWALILPF